MTVYRCVIDILLLPVNIPLFTNLTVVFVSVYDCVYTVHNAQSIFYTTTIMIFIDIWLCIKWKISSSNVSLTKAFRCPLVTNCFISKRNTLCCVSVEISSSITAVAMETVVMDTTNSRRRW